MNNSMPPAFGVSGAAIDRVEDLQKQNQELKRRLEYMDADRVNLIEIQEVDLKSRDHQIEILTRWKNEAMPILSAYMDIADTCSGGLGSIKHENLKKEVARLREVEGKYLKIPISMRILYK